MIARLELELTYFWMKEKNAKPLPKMAVQSSDQEYWRETDCHQVPLSLGSVSIQFKLRYPITDIEYTLFTIIVNYIIYIYRCVCVRARVCVKELVV